MRNPSIFQNIKSTVLSHFPDARILVFGSMIREDYSPGSDYDILVITKKTLTVHEKLKWSSLIDKALVKAIHAPVDVLLNSEEEISFKKELPGHVIRSAMKEGILL